MLTSTVSRQQELYPKKKKEEIPNYSSNNKSWSQTIKDDPVVTTPRPDDDDNNKTDTTMIPARNLVDYTKQRRNSMGSTAFPDHSCPPPAGVLVMGGVSSSLDHESRNKEDKKMEEKTPSAKIFLSRGRLDHDNSTCQQQGASTKNNTMQKYYTNNKDKEERPLLRPLLGTSLSSLSLPSSQEMTKNKRGTAATTSISRMGSASINKHSTTSKFATRDNSGQDEVIVHFQLPPARRGCIQQRNSLPRALLVETYEKRRSSLSHSSSLTSLNSYSTERMVSGAEGEGGASSSTEQQQQPQEQEGDNGNKKNYRQRRSSFSTNANASILSSILRDCDMGMSDDDSDANTSFLVLFGNSTPAAEGQCLTCLRTKE